MFDSAQQFKNQEKLYLPFDYSTSGLAHIQNILQSQVPLVSIKEIKKFRQLISQASVGEYFLIQSGDCAESFYECDSDTTYAKLEFLQQLAEFFQKKLERVCSRLAALQGNIQSPEVMLMRPLKMNKFILTLVIW